MVLRYARSGAVKKTQPMIRGALVEELSGGWWPGTHSSTRMKNEQLAKAREIGRRTASQFKWQMKGKT